MDKRSKILVITGPTASGKSELAVKLAKKYNGEIISCDSRQVYQCLNIGTGKVAGKWQPISFVRHFERVRRVKGPFNQTIKKFFIYKNIIHHCIDYVNPSRQYSVSRFQRDAKKAIKNILKRNRLPILCGGTTQYINGVVFDQAIPEVKPNKTLRAELGKKTVAALYEQLKKLDPERAKSIDPKNPRRLMRALEIILTTGRPVPALSKIKDSGSSKINALWLGINPGQETLYKKIDKRLKDRLKLGMVKEVERLHSPPFKGGVRGGYGLSWSRLESFGLEYKYISLYLQKKLSFDEMETQLSFAIKHYAKRQMTWLKRNTDITWITSYSEALQHLPNKK